MREQPLKTLRLRLTCPGPECAARILRRLARIPHVALTIIRARLAPEEARYELELTGSEARLQRVALQGRRWGLFDPRSA